MRHSPFRRAGFRLPLCMPDRPDRTEIGCDQPAAICFEISCPKLENSNQVTGEKRGQSLNLWINIKSSRCSNPPPTTECGLLLRVQRPASADASAVGGRGRPPAGAHADGEFLRLWLLAAGRFEYKRMLCMAGCTHAHTLWMCSELALSASSCGRTTVGYADGEPKRTAVCVHSSQKCVSGRKRHTKKQNEITTSSRFPT